MKHLFFVVLFLFGIITGAMAETVYLKDGKIVRGRIASEDEKSLLIELGDTWQRIDKSNIDRINKDNIVNSPIQPDLQQTEIKNEKRTDSNSSSANTRARTLDLRLRMGSAAGATDIEDSTGTLSLKDEPSGNFQIEADISIYNNSPVGLILSAGLFSRRHSGSYAPTNIDYDAAGISLGAGIGIKPNDKVHFEGKAELGLGAGKPKFTTPGYLWNETTASSYTSFSIILGAYLTVSRPGVQVGLELGSQAFIGDFTIRSNSGVQAPGTIKGSGGIANLVLGVSF